MKYIYIAVITALITQISSLSHASRSTLSEMAAKMEQSLGKYITYSYSIKDHDLSKGEKIDSLSRLDDFMEKLDVNGLAVVRSGQYLKIIDYRYARSQNPNTFNEKEVEDHELYTDLFQVKNGCSIELRIAILSTVRAFSHFVAYKPANLLLITDTKERVRKTKALLASIEKETPEGTTCESRRLREMYTALAAEIKPRHGYESRNK